MTFLPSRERTGAVFMKASRRPAALLASSASRAAAAPVGTSASLVACVLADLVGAGGGAGSATGGGGLTGSGPVLLEEPQAARNSSRRGRMRMARHLTRESGGAVDPFGAAHRSFG